MKRPWMPLNIGEFLQDTAHLSTTEIGAYMLLIMHYWARGGACPNLDAFRRVTRLTARQWAQSGDVLRSFFNDDLSHNRLDRDLAQVLKKSRINSTNVSHRYNNGSEVVDDPQADRTADLRPKIEKDVVVEEEARPRDVARPLPPERQAAIALGLTFLNAAGFKDYADAPINWYGVADRAAIWISNGWSEPMIVAETKMVRERAAGGVPTSLNYFETVFASAAARAARPTPIVNVKPAETRDVARTDNPRSTSSAFDRLARRLEQDDAEPSGAGGQVSGRLLAQG